MRLDQLNFNHLFYFWRVAKLGHLTQAAQELHTSQSAVSTQIRQLEERLGEELFLREGRRLLLTDTAGGTGSLGVKDLSGDIAKSLSLSVKTVSTYRTRLMEKMALASNSDLTYYALKNKLIVAKFFVEPTTMRR